MEKKPSFFKGLLLVFLYFIIYFFISGLVNSLLGLVSIDGVLLSSYTTIANIILSITVFGLPSILYCKFKKISVVDTYKIYKLNNKNIILTIIAALLLSPILSAIVGIFGYLFYGGSAQVAADEVIESGFILNFIGIAIVPSICEELMFRGLLYHKFRKHKPKNIAILTSLTFALIHMNLPQFSYTIIMGFCFFYLVYYTGSLLSGMLAHFVVNGFNMIQLFISMKFAKPEVVGAETASTSLLLELLLVVVCTILLFKVFGIIKKTNAQKDVIVEV